VLGVVDFLALAGEGSSEGMDHTFECAKNAPTHGSITYIGKKATDC